jgi:hypothetical protein
MTSISLNDIKTQMKEIPSNVMYALYASAAWMIVELALWLWLEVWRSTYYSCGPSVTFTLPFTDIVIDTWEKWGALMIHTSASSFIGAYCADMFYPWMGSVALNPSVSMPHDRPKTWLVVNCFWLVHTLNGLMFFLLVYSQIDVALVAAASVIAAGLFSSHRAIFDPLRTSGPVDALLDTV